MERFWLWLREFANNRVKACYMSKHLYDRKCDKCNTWTSEVGGCKDIVNDPYDPFFELMTCNKCGHISRWDCRFMFPMFAEEQPK